jgi:hypothetical protein
MTQQQSRIPRAEQPIEVYQGEAWTMDIALSGEGAPADLDGWDVAMDWRKSPGNPDTVASFRSSDSKTTIIPGEARVRFELTPAETAELPFGSLAMDVFLRDPQAVEFPIAVGSVRVYQRITRAEL